MNSFTEKWICYWDFKDGEKKARIFDRENDMWAHREYLLAAGYGPVTWDSFTLVEGS